MSSPWLWQRSQELHKPKPTEHQHGKEISMNPTPRGGAIGGQWRLGAEESVFLKDVALLSKRTMLQWAPTEYVAVQT